MNAFRIGFGGLLLSACIALWASSAATPADRENGFRLGMTKAEAFQNACRGPSAVNYTSSSFHDADGFVHFSGRIPCNKFDEAAAADSWSFEFDGNRCVYGAENLEIEFKQEKISSIQPECAGHRSSDFDAVPSGYPKAPDGGRRPYNIAVTGVTLKTVGKCTPRSNIYTYSIAVKNTGSGAYRGQRGPLVYMRDEQLDKGTQQLRWDGVLERPLPAMAPGATATVMVHIPYYAANPAYMAVSHRFITGVYWATPCSPDGCRRTRGPTVEVPAPKGCP